MVTLCLFLFLFFFKAAATTGFVEQPPFGVMPSVFELAPGYAILLEVGNETCPYCSPLVASSEIPLSPPLCVLVTHTHTVPTQATASVGSGQVRVLVSCRVMHMAVYDSHRTPSGLQIHSVAHPPSYVLTSSINLKKSVQGIAV